MIPGIVAGIAVGGGGGGTDPDFANVVSLIHFDGADGSTTFTDEIGHVWTPTSPAEISTDQAKFGGSSGQFTAGTNSRISTPASADWDWGTGDFTIEAQVYFTSTTRFYLMSLGGNDAAWIITPSSGVVEVYGPGSYVLNTGSTPFSTGQWYAMRLVRSGDDWTVLRDGVVYATVNDSRAWGNSTQALSVAADLTGSAQTLGGFVDEWRLTKGVARDAGGAYTPQAAPFPNS